MKEEEHQHGGYVAYKDDDLVSVVIPTYNREKYIGECIDSVLEQSYRNLEVIVIDDGSTDASRNVCERYGDKIRYFYKPNGGTASALNMGIAKMRGSWFVPLASDDALFSDAIENLLKVAESTDAKLISGDYVIVDSNGDKIKDRVLPSYNYHILASKLWLDYGCPYAMGCSLIRRSCFDTVGLFNEKESLYEDFDWWLRAVLLHRNTIMHAPYLVFKYRIHKSQKSRISEELRRHSLSNVRERVRQEIINTDGDWWRTLASYRIRYQRSPKRMLTKTALMLPEKKRTSLIHLWHKLKLPRCDC